MFAEFDPCSSEIPAKLTPEEARPFLDILISTTPCKAEVRELHRIGTIIDLSADLERLEGLGVAREACERLLSSASLDKQSAATLNYFLSNAWEATGRLKRDATQLHAWEQPELERQIIHLRKGVRIGKEARLAIDRLCEMLTNLGNLMLCCGRTVEALAAWDDALELDSTFGMALGNRGIGLFTYAGLVHDPGHQLLQLREAYTSLSKGLTDVRLHPGVAKKFQSEREKIEQRVSHTELTKEIRCKDFGAKWSPEERTYREWCLRNRFFLNDLNDLMLGAVAAADVLTLPSIITAVDAGQPNALGFFNQLKQEFVSARYLYFLGVTREAAHFSDRDVKLVNTHDYPSYGIAIERLKISYRVAYSLLDKVAYFLNDYLKLGIPERDVSFRSLWYNECNPKKGLRTSLIERTTNRGLKGLFWFSKDLFEPGQEFREAIEPEAQKLHEIRNHLEHKYLKLHELTVPKPNVTGIGFETLAYSMRRIDFEAKALRLLQLARSALIYLSQAVYAEEKQRSTADDERVVGQMYLDTWQDDWKI